MSSKVDNLIVELASKDHIDSLMIDIKRVCGYRGIEIDNLLELYIRECLRDMFLHGAIWQCEGGISGNAKKYGLED